MAKEIVNLKEELQALRRDVNLEQRIACPKEENERYQNMVKQGLPLPTGVYAYKDAQTGAALNEFYTIYTPDDLTETERNEYILLTQINEIKTIRKYLYFFVVLAVISILVVVFSFMVGLPPLLFGW